MSASQIKRSVLSSDYEILKICSRVYCRSRTGAFQVFTYVEQVPLLLTHFPRKLRELTPWLRDYVLEREAEWRQLPQSNQGHLE